MRKTKSRFAICINNREYPASLELHKLYRILPDKEAQADGDLRIIDESGEDYLFPADYFILVDLPQTRPGIGITSKLPFAQIVVTRSAKANVQG
jgi:hypothetical protein